jgi:hypothetical protein
MERSLILDEDPMVDLLSILPSKGVHNLYLSVQWRNIPEESSDFVDWEDHDGAYLLVWLD